jgi:hypothetical protein
MKKNTLIILILFCTAQIFAQNSGQASGIIKEFTGTLEIKRPGQEAFVPAKPGDNITKDTVVSTGFKSVALISVGSATLTVRPLTRLTLAEISASAGDETVNVNLQTGKVRVDVNPPAGTRALMNVQSPAATASVRGTSFEFDTQNLVVFDGTVTFQGNRGGVIFVNAGSTSEIKDSGKAADTIETYAARLQLPPLAGSDSGFRHSGFVSGSFSDNSTGELGVDFELQ